MPPSPFLGRPLAGIEWHAAEHGWTYTIGWNLFQIEARTQLGRDDGLAVGEIREDLDRRNIRQADGRPFVIFPNDQRTTPTSGPRELDEILDRVMRQYTFTHAASLLIGSACACLQFSKIVIGDNVQNVLRTRGFDYLNKINDLNAGRFPEHAIDPGNLRDHFLSFELDGLRTQDHLRQTTLTILMINADLRDQGRLRLHAEEQAMRDALNDSRYRSAFTIHTLSISTVPRIIQAIQLFQPTVLHYSGHAGTNGLAIEDGRGNTMVLDDMGLRAILREAVGLKLVVLNACATRNLAVSAARSIGFSVTMRDDLDDDAASQWTRVFYNALGNGQNLNQSFRWALGSILADPATRYRIRPYLTSCHRN
jgi:hypothetical protein